MRRAKSDGKKIGRPRVDADLGWLRQLVNAGYSTRKIAEAMGLKKSTAASLVKAAQKPS